MAIADMIRQHTTQVKLYQTVRPDIVFTVRGEQWAVEIETGKNRTEMVEEKAINLSKTYGDKWFFVLVNSRRHKEKYAKWGKTYSRKELPSLIQGMFQSGI